LTTRCTRFPTQQHHTYTTQRISYDVAPASELVSVAAVTPSDDKDRLTECYMFGAGGDGQLGRVGDSNVYRPRQLTFSRASWLLSTTVVVFQVALTSGSSNLIVQGGRVMFRVLGFRVYGSGFRA